MPFASLGLAPELVRAVADEGYTEPTPIQQEAIPLALAGRDLIGSAQTRTGKTAAFMLPILQRLPEPRPPPLPGAPVPLAPPRPPQPGAANPRRLWGPLARRAGGAPVR